MYARRFTHHALRHVFSEPWRVPFATSVCRSCGGSKRARHKRNRPQSNNEACCIYKSAVPPWRRRPNDVPALVRFASPSRPVHGSGWRSCCGAYESSLVGDDDELGAVAGAELDHGALDVGADSHTGYFRAVLLCSRRARAPPGPRAGRSPPRVHRTCRS